MTHPTHTPSRACYQRGCDRPECEQANRRYMKHLRLDYAHGKRRRQDATPTITRIQQLRATGWSLAQISRTSGVHEVTIRVIASGKNPTVSNKNAHAVLAVPVGPPPTDGPIVNATGSVRRLQALAVMGYSTTRLAELLGINRFVVGRIMRGQHAAVHATTASTIAEGYRRLARVPGGSVRARGDARRRGWHGPAAWDGEAIDDPRARPDIDERATA
ncbi:MULTISPECIES: hypothetical protein [unclassified Streptomyces]|uniref:hypothetical protein n=1 Tax=unclassified Streptomyces TaxID=2593676 RepID=UPI001488B28F|nr:MULTISPECIES: hypothetical protein [unclassified Streptomyces]